MGNNIIYPLLAIVAGISVTLQGPINTSLGKSLKSPDLATFWAFFGGTVLIGIYLLAKKEPVPDLAQIKEIPVWSYLGAVTGIIYVALVILVTPKLGVGTTTVLLLLAQIITALVLDHFGVFGFIAKPINLVKVAGVVLMTGGVFLISK
ncbi:DMT family transporter [Caviibacter abscessus]|uniref:DMT family transporter n=1 Tax=Caviibacter abscessus TaxID=1766719 RepID=UPI00083069CA|nr:DMT family transporter [Caviibacter abscessus]